MNALKQDSNGKAERHLPDFYMTRLLYTPSLVISSERISVKFVRVFSEKNLVAAH